MNESTNAQAAQCAMCLKAIPNTGRLVPKEEQTFFCCRIEAIKDEAVADLLGPLMVQLSKQGRCPGFDSGEASADAYRSIDL